MASSSLVAAIRSTTQQILNPTSNLENAVKEFRDVLDDDQKQRLESMGSAKVESVMSFVAYLDEENQKRRGRGIFNRVFRVMETVHTFTKVVDTFVSSNPEIAALVWGSVKLTMLVPDPPAPDLMPILTDQIAVNFLSYFEALSELFMTFGKHCPRYIEYEALFPDSVHLQKAICDFHAGLVRCCKHAVEAAQRSVGLTILHSLYHSFQAEFKPDLDMMQRLEKEVKGAITLAKAQADERHQKLQREEIETTRSRWRRLSIHTAGTELRLEAIQDLQIQQSRYNSVAENQRLLQFLSDHDHRAPFSEACRKRHPSTTEWLFKTPEYVKWHRTADNQLLWCSGIIGSGKTVLCAKAITTVFLEQRIDDAVTFFFATPDNDQSLRAETMIRSIIKQSLPTGMLTQEMKTKLLELEARLFTSVQDWIEILRNRLQAFHTFYLFLDGLDECHPDERRKLLEILSPLAQGNLKLFFTSRDSLQVDLQRSFEGILEIRLTHSRLNANLSLYIDFAIQKSITNEDLMIDSDDRLIDRIRSRVAEQANGMFLLVDFLLRDICIASYEDGIEQALEQLPQGIEELFTRALSRIQSRQRMEVFAQRVFRWTAVSKVPLTIEQLHEVLYIDIGQRYSGPRKPKKIDRLVLWCENLVSIGEEYQTVHFAHSTVRQFLLSSKLPPELESFHIDLIEMDRTAGDICITYLNFNDFKTAMVERPKGSSLEGAHTVGIMLRSTSKTARRVQQILTPKRGSSTFDLGAAIKKYGASGQAEDGFGAYQFLEYAQRYWIHHTKHFDPATSADSTAWVNMASGSHPLAKFPWSSGNGGGDQIVSTIVWAYDNDHLSLLSFLVSAMLKQGKPMKIPEELVEATLVAKTFDLCRLLIEYGDFNYNDKSRLFGLVDAVELEYSQAISPVRNTTPASDVEGAVRVGLDAPEWEHPFG